MSELIQKRTSNANHRRALLATASTLALVLMAAGPSKADEAERPTVWIELGGQMERVDGGAAPLMPTFTINTANFTSPAKVQRLPRYAIGGEGKFTLEPKDSDWSFAVDVRYGRSNNAKKLHQETQPPSAYKYISIPAFGIHGGGTIPAPAKGFMNTVSRNDENHTVMDFMAGKDIGLGLFGTHGESTFSGGVRFAQFSSSSSVAINADPDFHFSYVHYSVLPPPFPPLPGNIDAAVPKWHIYTFKGDVARSFRGLGPTLAWNASARLTGNRDVALAMDWGLNAAVLFGKQKTRMHHQTTSVYHYNSANADAPEVYPHTSIRSRSVVIPNVGGFAGLSLKFPNAKISLGYRADMFFGAVDGGIDTRKTYDRAFYGPFANFSIGLGG